MVAIPVLQEKLAQCARERGASYFGVADLAPAHKAIVEQGGDFLAKFPYAVSIGVALADGVVDELYKHLDPIAVGTYRYHAYEAVNPVIDDIDTLISRRLQDAGYLTLPVPSSQRLRHDTLAGVFSHKLASHLAGHGWIGKSCLLITPDRGPRVRWGTVLTNAPLKPGQPITGTCGTCQECVEKCPMQAFTGASFVAEEPREVRFLAQKCSDYLAQRRQTIGYPACGLCVYACPFGRSKKRLLRKRAARPRVRGGSTLKAK